jgi:hypothetical protein
VILAPKFLEFLILSIHAFIALGNSVPEPLFKDFQEQVFEDPEVFFSGQQDKCP